MLAKRNCGVSLYSEKLGTVTKDKDNSYFRVNESGTLRQRACQMLRDRRSEGTNLSA